MLVLKTCRRGIVYFQICAHGASRKLKREMTFGGVERLRWILPRWYGKGGGLELPASGCCCWRYEEGFYCSIMFEWEEEGL